MSVIRHSVRAAAVLCAAAIVATPASAHAQFGKLKDLGKRAAGSVVEKKVEDEASKKVAGAADAADPGAEAKPGSVEFTDGVIEITEERLAALAKGVDAEEAARPAAEREFQAKLAAARQADATYEARRAVYDREYAAYDKRKTEIEACHERVSRKYEHAGDADAARTEKIANDVEADMSDAKVARMKALGERITAANARGDMATVKVLNDSLQKEMAVMMAAGREGTAMAQRANATSAEQQKEAKACGDPGPAPQSPNAGGYVDSEGARHAASAAGAKVAGMTPQQYAIMRERVENYARLKGRVGRSRYAYTKGELSALQGPNAQRLFANPNFGKAQSWNPEGE